MESKLLNSKNRLRRHGEYWKKMIIKVLVMVIKEQKRRVNKHFRQ